jgi:mRNA interferase RelE/StbE
VQASWEVNHQLVGREQAPRQSIFKGSKKGERRVDVGEYRIIYCDDADNVEVLVIGKRDGSEAYKLWERMTK